MSQQIQESSGDRGRVSVRLSATENLMRVRMEGENDREISAFGEELAVRIRKNREGWKK